MYVALPPFTLSAKMIKWINQPVNPLRTLQPFQTFSKCAIVKIECPGPLTAISLASIWKILWLYINIHFVPYTGKILWNEQLHIEVKLHRHSSRIFVCWWLPAAVHMYLTHCSCFYRKALWAIHSHWAWSRCHRLCSPKMCAVYPLFARNHRNSRSLLLCADFFITRLNELEMHMHIIPNFIRYFTEISYIYVHRYLIVMVTSLGIVCFYICFSN